MFRIQDIFDALPTQKIPTTELKQGDVAYIRRGWVFVKEAHLDKDCPNNNLNFVIHHFESSGRSFVKENEELTILSRDILNKDVIGNIILKLQKEEEEHARRQREQQEEERQMLIRERDRLNRMIGDE